MFFVGYRSLGIGLIYLLPNKSFAYTARNTTAVSLFLPVSMDLYRTTVEYLFQVTCLPVDWVEGC